MKRTAATLALLAGLGGGCASTDNSGKQASAPTGKFGVVSQGQQVPGLVGPTGEPIIAARAAAPSAPATASTANSSGIQQAALFTPAASTTGDCPTCAHVPGSAGMPMWNGEVVSKVYAAANGNLSGGPAPAYGPVRFDNRGIMPVPGQGPPGAVAAVGALPMSGGGYGAQAGLAIGRSSIKFTGPAGMKITWQLPNGSFNDETSGLTAPKEYNFLQGQTYRLRLTQILPNFPGKSFYPTLEVAPANPKTLTFLAHSSVPLTFTNDDFEQARSGNLVVKVIYLPDRENQDFATVAGAEELVSTRLEPGADPVAEAQRKGSILAVVRLGNIDLENRVSPSMTSPPPSMVPPRTGPVLLPAPAQTTPGVGSGPLAPPKQMAPLLPSIPMVPSAGGTSGSSTSKGGSASPSTTPIQIPVAPGSTSGDAGLPTILPPVVPSVPGSGSSSTPSSLPPTK